MSLPATEWEQALQELMAWLRFASVSADPAYRDDVMACATHTAGLMARYGLSVTTVPTPGHPVLIGTWHGAPQAPTVLIYGHYDVQPPDPIALWHSAPFDPIIQDGQLIARGASDNKGQIFCHLKAIDYLLRTTGELPVNVTVIIEGEEETGSLHLPDVLTAHQKTLAADIALVSDTPMLAENRPSLCTSLRGLVYIELTLTTLGGDLHSGQHGGAVPNAIGALVTLLSQFKDQNEHVTIPGFYDKVRPITPGQSEAIQQLGLDPDAYAASIGARGLWGEKGYHPYEQRWYRPTFDINGIWGGYTLEGEKTVIPAQAHAKVSMRLVADQDPDEVITAFGKAIEAMTPSYAQVSWHVCSKAHPAVVDPHHPAVSAAMAGLEGAFGVPPVFQGEGGTIPIVAGFKRLLGLDTILMGLNLPEDKIHAPNEQLSIANIQRGIAASMGFLYAYGKGRH